MRAAGALDHAIAWKSFSLEHVNLEADKDADTEVWGQPERRRGILPAAAAQWAAAEGSDVFDTVQLAFFEANHVQRRKIGKPEVVQEVLDETGLDGSRVLKELLNDRRWIRQARAEHLEADELNIFGVPTLVFPGRQPVFVRLIEICDGDRAVEIYERVRTMSSDPVIHELKKTTGNRG